MSDSLAATGRSQRLWQLDALRGLMLVLMTLTHVPTRLTQPMGQPFGFVSAAFGFVLISGLLVGRVHGGRLLRLGMAPVRRALWRRAGVVYLCHLGLLAILFGLLPHTGVVPEKGPLPGMMWYFTEAPAIAVPAAIGLVHQPGLLDILPMYVLFLLASPLALALLVRGHWPVLAGLSALLWLGAQFGLGALAYEAAVALTGVPVPRAALGAFDLFAWQLVWFGGLGFGWALARGWQPRPSGWPGALLALAAAVALVGFVWRHGVGQIPFPAHEAWNAWLDKWHMGPLRLLDALALVVLVMRFGPRRPEAGAALSGLCLLGRSALPVFFTHAVVAMLVLGLVGDEIGARPWTVDAAILAITFSALFAVAWVADGGAARLRRRARTCASTA